MSIIQGKTHLVVDQPPLLEERVYPHNSADISGEVTATSRDSEVFNRIQSVSVDHKISVILVNGGCLAAVPTIEELCQSLLLNGVHSVHIEPCGITWENNCMCLRNEM